VATLTTLSDHILDICENAAYANSSECKLEIYEDDENFKFIIKDNGKGMEHEDLKLALDPFFTTKEERIKKFGFGLPFLKHSSEMTGGYFNIDSKKGIGTKIECCFKKNNIDCQPIGDLGSTLFSVVYLNTNVEWEIKRSYKDNVYSLNTKSLKEIIGDLNRISVMKELKEIIISLENEIREDK
jgi:hypothetical protein